MQNLHITDGVLEKLKTKHKVSRAEVEQCFANRMGKLLEDRRAKHATTPPTLWFLAPTNKGRKLKIVYVQNGPRVDLKSAFDPLPVEIEIYARHG